MRHDLEKIISDLLHFHIVQDDDTSLEEQTSNLCPRPSPIKRAGPKWN